MRLSNARYGRNDGYAELTVEVDGRTATFCGECKPTLFAAGLVFLGSTFGDVVPPIDFELPRQEGGGTTRLEGFTRDPRVHRLYSDFLKATANGTFAEGPVTIPA